MNKQGRPKVYENGSKNVLGVYLDRFGFEVKCSTILIFKVIFLCQNPLNLSDFFSFQNMKIGEQLILLMYFDNFDF